MKTIPIILAGTILLLTGSVAMAQNGSALSFDGGDYVVVSDPVDVRGPLTIEAWIRPDVFDGGRFVSNRGSGGYEMDVIEGGYVRFTVNSSVRAMADINIYEGTWVHIAATWAGVDSATVVLYVNGEVASQGNSSTPIEAPEPTLHIGSMPSGNYRFTGAIDEVRIFSTALDQTTIAGWYTRSIDAGHPAYADLEAAWSFEEGAGQTAASSGSVTGRDGMLGSGSGDDAADPAWIGSGMTASELITIDELKAFFR